MEVPNRLASFAIEFTGFNSTELDRRQASWITMLSLHTEQTTSIVQLENALFVHSVLQTKI